MNTHAHTWISFVKEEKVSFDVFSCEDDDDVDGGGGDDSSRRS